MELIEIAQALDDQIISKCKYDRVMKVALKIYRDKIRSAPFMITDDSCVYWINARGFIYIIKDAVASEYFPTPGKKQYA